jgi:carboxyvinyl-carboxyphosphonate phosphorylmutase
VTDLQDTIARVKAYQDTGVDAIFLIGIKQMQQLEAIAEVCHLPIFLGGAGADINQLDTLGPMGVRISLQGHQPVMAAMQATYDTLKALRDGARPADIDSPIDRDLINMLSRVDDYDAWIEEFLE